MLRKTFKLARQPALHFIKMNDPGDHHPLGFLGLYLGKHGALSAYREFPVNGFDSFGLPFDHFPRRKQQRYQKPTGDHWPPAKKTCEDLRHVNYCPLNWTHQDGHHETAKFVGWDRKRNPHLDEPRRDGGFVGWQVSHNLFINWHPGTLGQEVIGNQIAYFYMSAMEVALTRLLSGDLTEGSEFLTDLDDSVLQRPLPSNQQCSDLVCSPQFDNKCAYSFLPKQLRPDVGDIMINETASRWTNLPTEGNRRTDCEDYKDLSGPRVCTDPTDACLDHYRDCSYADQKRGMYGTSKDGALVLGFDDMYSCTIWIGEAMYGWVRPPHVANWFYDMKYRVNGQDCESPNCEVFSFGGYYMLVVRARNILGKQCRRQTVKVELEVSPSASTSHECKGDPHGCKIGSSAADRKWQGYPSEENPNRADSWCTMSGGRCTPVPRYTDRAKIATFVTYAIWF